MQPLQLSFIAFTFLAPPLLWLLSRGVRSPRLARGISRALAALLIVAYVGALCIRASTSGLSLADSLPMQLCDWASVITVLALLLRSALAFELAYFWGLAGTLQALFTPAIEVQLNLAVICFFFIHSTIPASVLWLMFEYGEKPRRGAFLRIFLWSEIYLATTLTVNALTGGNYGFLDHRPATHSLLDSFSDTHWLYVAEMNLTGLLAFALLALPWWLYKKATSDKTANSEL
jgi:hypothetical integral membrane protein (TIGR02206 family)